MPLTRSKRVLLTPTEMPQYQSPDPQITLDTVHEGAKKAISQSSWGSYARSTPKYPYFTSIRDSNHEFILSFLEIIGLLRPSVATFTTHDTK